MRRRVRDNGENVELSESVRSRVFIGLGIEAATRFLNFDNIHILRIMTIGCRRSHRLLPEHPLEFDLDSDLFRTVLLGPEEEIVRAAPTKPTASQPSSLVKMLRSKTTSAMMPRTPRLVRSEEREVAFRMTSAPTPRPFPVDVPGSVS